MPVSDTSAESALCIYIYIYMLVHIPSHVQGTLTKTFKKVNLAFDWVMAMSQASKDWLCKVETVWWSLGWTAQDGTLKKSLDGTAAKSQDVLRTHQAGSLLRKLVLFESCQLIFHAYAWVP